jgi:hypothetical protein
VLTGVEPGRRIVRLVRGRETPPLPLPEHPELRELAQALEAAGVAAEILDYKWRVVYTTSEDALGLGLDPAEMHHHYGLSLVIQPEHRPDWVTDRHPRQPK